MADEKCSTATLCRIPAPVQIRHIEPAMKQPRPPNKTSGDKVPSDVQRCIARTASGERCQRWRSPYGGALCGLHFQLARKRRR